MQDTSNNNPPQNRSHWIPITSFSFSSSSSSSYSSSPSSLQSSSPSPSTSSSSELSRRNPPDPEKDIWPVEEHPVLERALVFNDGDKKDRGVRQMAIGVVKVERLAPRNPTALGVFTSMIRVSVLALLVLAAVTAFTSCYSTGLSGDWGAGVSKVAGEREGKGGSHQDRLTGGGGKGKKGRGEDEDEEGGEELKPEEVDEGLKAPPTYAKPHTLPRRNMGRDKGDSGGQKKEWKSLQKGVWPKEKKHRKVSGSSTLDVRRVLQQHVAFPGTETCGAWADSYRKLHRAIRSGNSSVPRKYLTYEPVRMGPGMGDRINGLVAAFMVALLTNRAFIMADTRIAGAFEPAEIDWHVRDDVPTQVTTERMDNTPEGSVLRIHAKNGDSGMWRFCPACDGMVWDIIPHFGGTEGADNIVLHAHRGIITQIFSHPESGTFRKVRELGLRLPTAFGCIMRFVLRPRKRVLQLAEQPLTSLMSSGSNTPKVCVHVRSGDAIAWSGDTLETGDNGAVSPLLARALRAMHSLMGCAQALDDWWVPASKFAKWFVMSDSDYIEDSILAEHPGKVVVSGVKPQHLSHGGMTSTAVDWLLFTMCDYYVLVESGLSKTAYAYNLNNPPLYIYSRLDGGGESQGSCDPSRPRSFMDLMGWSSL